jgi:uncharacterized membrane protein
MDTNNDANKYTTLIQVLLVLLVLFICVPVFIAFLKSLLIGLVFLAGIIYFAYACLKKRT